MTAMQRLSDLLEGHALTQADLEAQSGLSTATIWTGLFQLRKLGVLKTRKLPSGGKMGRPHVIYSTESAA